MNDKKTLAEIQKDKIISLAREYVENTKCSCNNACCWKCLFEYNLNFIPEEQAKESAVATDTCKHKWVALLVDPPIFKCSLCNKRERR